MAANAPTERFSERVDNYVKYRPTYPPEVIDLLKSQCGLTPADVIADIASGTGIFTRLLLEDGNPVYGIEPNVKMREAGEKCLAQFANFTSLAATAEATTLPTHSVDFITAAQAAHWFRLAEARCEFVRILKPGGWVVLLWNERLIEIDQFHRDYEQLLLTYGIDYKEVRHEKTTAIIHQFFAPNAYRSATLKLVQQFDYEGLEGRLLSSSYIPGPEDSRFQPMIRELKRIFDTEQQNGKVTFHYNTLIYYAQLT
jgi:SAM-dependent methyltransferase